MCVCCIVLYVLKPQCGHVLVSFVIILCYVCVVDCYLLYFHLHWPPVLIPQACVNCHVHFSITQLFSLGQVATTYWESEYPF